MQIARTIAEVRRAVQAARSAGRGVTLVPTMGALHAGHLSLIEAARRRPGDFVVVSIFVNPTQFGPGEDFERYPRAEAADLEACRAAGVSLAFLPTAAEMYPAGAVTQVRVAKLTDTLCGPHRPGHFDGVATVVAKLLNIVGPERACFGQKDAQQLAVIRRMVRDLDIPVEVVGCPTVREADGLAMSSRNAYLSAEQRKAARSLYAALRLAEERVRGGETSAAALEAEMRRRIESAGADRIDYVSFVDPQTMQPVERVEGVVLAAVAVYFGETRLIDNLTMDPRGRGE